MHKISNIYNPVINQFFLALNSCDVTICFTCINVSADEAQALVSEQIYAFTNKYNNKLNVYGVSSVEMN